MKNQKIRHYQKKLFFCVYIKMFKITRKNCYKCDLETIILNDGRYFWINIKGFEAETECSWQNNLISMEIYQLWNTEKN